MAPYGRFRTPVYVLLAGILGASPREVERGDRLQARRRASVAMVVLALLVAGALILVERSNRSANEARSRKLADRALSVSEGRGDLALLVAARSALLRVLEKERRMVRYLWQSDTLSAVAISDDGRRVGAAVRHGRVPIWDLADPATVRVVSTGETAHVRSAALSADGELVAGGDVEGLVRVWRASAGAPVGQPVRLAGSVAALAFSEDGRSLVVLTQRTAHLLDVFGGRPLAASRPAVAAGFIGTEAVVWTGSRLERWGGESFAPDGGARARWATSRQVALSPDGAWVARSAAGSAAVEVLSARTGAV